MLRAAVTTILVTTAAAVAGESDCCYDNGTARCTDFGCASVVCVDDPFCCIVSWDLNCVRQAETLCGICTPGGQACPGPGDCCIAKTTPGCDDAACCDAVCLEDPFCCEGRWDVFCAADARVACTGCAGATPCAEPDAGDCCRDNGTPGCVDPTCCDTICLVDPFCCAVRWDLTCATQAGDACAPGLCGVACPVTGDCCTGHDDPGCEDAGCCALVCSLDPSCCFAVWDALCAELADGTCASCGGIFGGDCCRAHPNPGCDDAECTATICAADPFCCDTEWDQICVDQALDVCVVCGVLRPCPGDTDADGDVDVDDLNHVIIDWGTDGGANGGDITDPTGTGPPDGVVDVNDLNAVIVNWGACPAMMPVMGHRQEMSVLGP